MRSASLRAIGACRGSTGSVSPIVIVRGRVVTSPVERRQGSLGGGSGRGAGRGGERGLAVEGGDGSIGPSAAAATTLSPWGSPVGVAAAAGTGIPIASR